MTTSSDSDHDRNGPTTSAERLASVATFALLLLILILRARDRLAAPDFWAEDGAVFLSQALVEGPRSLLHPMAGSYFTIERLVMLVALKVTPIVRLPFVVCLSCIVITALVLSRFARDAYAWLVPSRVLRVLAACLFCLLPGLTEMLGNLCNVNWILFCGLALIGLKDPRRPITVFELVAAALITVSVGTSIVLAPLFVWRAALTRSSRYADRSPVGDLIVFAVILLVGGALPALLGGSRAAAPPGATPIAIAHMWYDHLARLVAFTPWIGDRLTFRVSEWHPTGLYRIGKIAFLLFIAAWAWRNRRRTATQAVLVLLAGVSTWTVLSVFTRTYAFDLLQRQHGAWFYESRYSFILSFVAVIFWLVVLRPPSGPGRMATTLTAVFVALNVTLAWHRFDIDAYGHLQRVGRATGFIVTVVPGNGRDAPADTTHWRAAAPQLARAIASGCPQRVRIRQYPDPWEFEYVNPHPLAACQ